MEKSEGENPPDGLEIISIGALYSGGPWEKKYWSCSRGKDRYPYPIGYHAVRTHAGCAYKMEIQEGLKGPLFVITSMEGDSFAGQTPDIAWEHFQKKSGPRVKTWHAKRFSCKIDGIELFGFRNPHVQRLLRELAANAYGMAERILIHPSFCNGASNLEQEIRSSNSCTYPNLLEYLEKQQGTGKRSRKLKNNSNSVAGDNIKRIRTHRTLDDAKVNIAAIGNTGIHGSNDPDVLQQTIKHKIPDHFHHSKKRSVDSVNDGLTFPQDFECHNDGKHTVSFNTPDQNCVAHKGPASVSLSNVDAVTEIIVNKNFLSVSSEFPNHSGEVPGCPQELSKLVVEDSQVAYVTLSGVSLSSAASQDLVPSKEAIIGSHPEEGNGTYCASRSSSAKSDSDSAGQDLVKTMMTVLLPQALPLLKKTSKNKRTMNAGVTLTKSAPCLNLKGFKSSAETNEMSHFADDILQGHLVAGLSISGSNPNRDEKIQVSQSILVDSPESGTPSDLKSVIPDSFEEQNACCFVNQRPRNSEFHETGQEILSKKACDINISAFLNKTDGAKESSSFCCGNGNRNEIVTELNDPPEDDSILVSVNPVNWISYSKHSLLDGGNEKMIKDVGYPIVSQSNNMLESSLKNVTDAVSYVADDGIAAVDTRILVQDNADSEVAVLPPHENLRSMNTEILSSYRQDCSAKELQKILVLTDPAASNTCKLSMTTDARETNCDANRQSTAIDARTMDSYGKEDALQQMQCNGKTVASGICGNSLIHTLKHDDAASTGSHTIVSYSRREYQSSSLPSQNQSTPLSESIIFRNIENKSIFEMDSAVSTLCMAEVCQASAAENIDGVLLNSPKRDPERQQNNMNTLMGISEPDGMLSNNAPVALQNQAPVVQVNNDIHAVGDFCPSVHDVELHQGDAINEMVIPCKPKDSSNAVFFMNEKGRTSPDKNGSSVYKTPMPNLHNSWKSVSNEFNILPHSVFDSKHPPQDNILLKESKPSNEFEGFVNLVGCYIHPAPILSVLLSRNHDDIYICVLCGILQEKKRTLFIYKVTAESLSENCPSFLGYTSIELPVPRGGFNEVTIDRSGLQFTPDGQCLVLLNSIKVPGCREQNIDCLCSVCTCGEENAIKVVQVQAGCVSIVCKLATVETIYCILVCAPCYLVGAEASGRLHVWIMNLTWSACVEEFTLPSFDHPCPSLIELRRIPKCDSLVIGHNAIGGFGIWDISKRVCLSSFSSPGISVSHVLPVGVFGLEKKFPIVSGSELEEHVKEIIAATKLWFSRDRENYGLLPDGDNIALWVLVSTALDADEQSDHMGTSFNGGLFGQWRLAMLVKRTVIMGCILDPRASAVMTSSGHAIIGTQDGLVYIWEMLTGNRVANLKHLKGGVSYIASDATSSALAVVGNDCQMMLYIRIPENQ